jgi:hypothetical protein
VSESRRRGAEEGGKKAKPSLEGIEFIPPQSSSLPLQCNSSYKFDNNKCLHQAACAVSFLFRVGNDEAEAGWVWSAGTDAYTAVSPRLGRR